MQRGDTPADGVPVVVVVEGRSTRRHRLAAVVERAGARAVEVATPLDAVVAIEQEPGIEGVVVGTPLTQTSTDELAQFVRTEHPELGVSAIEEDEPTGRVEVPLPPSKIRPS